MLTYDGWRIPMGFFMETLCLFMRIALMLIKRECTFDGYPYSIMTNGLSFSLGRYDAREMSITFGLIRGRTSLTSIATNSRECQFNRQALPHILRISLRVRSYVFVPQAKSGRYRISDIWEVPKTLRLPLQLLS